MFAGGSCCNQGSVWWARLILSPRLVATTLVILPVPPAHTPTPWGRLPDDLTAQEKTVRWPDGYCFEPQFSFPSGWRVLLTNPQVHRQVRIRQWRQVFQVRGEWGRRLQRKENPGNRSWASPSCPPPLTPSSTCVHSLCNGLASPQASELEV